MHARAAPSDLTFQTTLALIFAVSSGACRSRSTRKRPRRSARRARRRPPSPSRCASRKATFDSETNAPVATIVSDVVASLLAVTECDCPTPQVDAVCASAAALLAVEPWEPAQAAEETEETQQLAEDLAEEAGAVEALLARTPAEGTFASVGSVVLGKVVAREVLKATVAAVDVDVDDVAWHDLVHDETGDEETARDFEASPAQASGSGTGRRSHPTIEPAQLAEREAAQATCLASLAGARRGAKAAKAALAAAQSASLVAQSAGPPAARLPTSAADSEVLATAAARPTCEHVADRLEDQGEASTGGNWESVLRGLRATRAPHVAAVLDPTWLQGGGQGEATAALEALGDFDFVAADVVATVTAELPSFLAQAVGHSDLPAVVVADDRATRGHSAGEQADTLADVPARRTDAPAPVQAAPEGPIVPLVEPEAGSPGVPSTAVDSLAASEPESVEFDGVEVLESGQDAVVAESHAILEWWRRPCSPEQGSLPRWREFPARGALLRRVALASPHAAAGRAWRRACWRLPSGDEVDVGWLRLHARRRGPDSARTSSTPSMPARLGAESRPCEDGHLVVCGRASRAHDRQVHCSQTGSSATHLALRSVHPEPCSSPRRRPSGSTHCTEASLLVRHDDRDVWGAAVHAAAHAPRRPMPSTRPLALGRAACVDCFVVHVDASILTRRVRRLPCNSRSSELPAAVGKGGARPWRHARSLAPLLTTRPLSWGVGPAWVCALSPPSTTMGSFATNFATTQPFARLRQLCQLGFASSRRQPRLPSHSSPAPLSPAPRSSSASVDGQVPLREAARRRPLVVGQVPLRSGATCRTARLRLASQRLLLLRGRPLRRAPRAGLHATTHGHVRSGHGRRTTGLSRRGRIHADARVPRPREAVTQRPRGPARDPQVPPARLPQEARVRVFAKAEARHTHWCCAAQVRAHSFHCLFPCARVRVHAARALAVLPEGSGRRRPRARKTPGRRSTVFQRLGRHVQTHGTAHHTHFCRTGCSVTFPRSNGAVHVLEAAATGGDSVTLALAPRTHPLPPSRGAV